MDKKEKGLIVWAMKYNKIIILIVGLLILFGMIALKVMPKQEFPIFTIRQGVVVGVYPGATSAEVEEQLTKPLERYLFTFKEVKKSKTYSYSRDGMSYVFVELNDNVNNKDDVWSKIKHGLALFKMQLPKGVLAVIANDDFGDTSALLITIESKTKTPRQLQDYIENLEDKLRTIESVSNLRRYGVQKEQISIYIEKEKVANYGINIMNLYQALLTKGFITISGKVDNNDLVVPIHIARPYKSELDFEEQIVYSDARGNHIKLKDIAQVVREYPKPDSYTTNNGIDCLVLSAEMREGYNIVQYGREVDAVIATFSKEIPSDVKISRIVDQPQVVNASTTTFLKELLIAIIAVILVTMTLLPLRVAGVAASSIPITIFIAIGLMFMFGIELNTVTLAALVVVLGMIVDNSIVIVDSYLENLDRGIPRHEAAISSAKEYSKAIFSATLAIGITFFPFLITYTGQLYDFVLTFPWTVFITLGVSLLIALILIPYLLYFFVKKGLVSIDSDTQKSHKEKKSLLEKIQSAYNKLIETVFKHPKTTLTIGITSVIIGVVLSFSQPLMLMPVAERNQFAVELFLPQGSSLHQTEKVAKDMESILQKDSRITSVSAFIGSSSPRFHTVYTPKLGGSNFAQFIVNTESNQATEDILDDYSTRYAYHYPNAYIKFKQLDYQLGVDADIEVRISSDSISYLKDFAKKLEVELNMLNEPLRIYTNYEEILPGVNVKLDPIESNRLGINETLLSLGLASRFGGLPITTIWEKDYDLPVVLKSKWDTIDPNAEDVSNEYIPGILSPAVPLQQIATISTDWNEGQIAHRNGVRTLSIYVDLKRGEEVGKAQNKVAKIVNRVLEEDKNSDKLTIAYGGIKEFHDETLPKIGKGLFISIFIIFFILVFHFKKIKLAVLILLSTLLSILGAVLGLKIIGLDFSMTAVLGVVSLIGIIVRNGIIMYDYIEELRFKEGHTVLNSCIEAGKRRMRPIFLTSAAASMGVIPMIISKSPLWAPMGTVICFGTMISMFFILTILPLIYWYSYRNADQKKTK